MLPGSIHAARQEVLSARDRTLRTRQERKRQEREGVSHAMMVKTVDGEAAATWVPVSELEVDGWLKWLD